MNLTIMRPQFLTLLCILTFLSCGLGLIDNTISLIHTQEVSKTKRADQRRSPEVNKNDPPQYFEDRASGDAPMPGDPDEIRWLAIAGLIYSSITLIGALLMFRLRRVGFYVYLVGVAVGLILPVAFVGFSALNTSFGAFFSAIFAGLYWYNLPAMR